MEKLYFNISLVSTLTIYSGNCIDNCRSIVFCSLATICTISLFFVAGFHSFFTMSISTPSFISGERQSTSIQQKCNNFSCISPWQHFSPSAKQTSILSDFCHCSANVTFHISVSFTPSSSSKDSTRLVIHSHISFLGASYVLFLQLQQP